MTFTPPKVFRCGQGEKKVALEQVKEALIRGGDKLQMSAERSHVTYTPNYRCDAVNDRLQGRL